MGKEIQFWFRLWLVNNRHKWPRYAAVTAAVAVGLLLASVGVTAMHPAAGEIAQNVLIAAGAIINLALVAILALCFVGAALYNFGHGVTIETPTVRLLGSGGWNEPDIYPDILVAYRPGETPEQFMARYEQAVEQAGNGTWVVVVPFQFPSGAIYETPDRCRDFLRSETPFPMEWPDAIFRQETLQEYAAYLAAFAPVFREWSSRVKISGEAIVSRKLDLLKSGIRASLNTAVFLLLAVSSFAQNAAQVSQALGTRIREIPPAGAEVTYEFETKEFSRVADGRRDYVSLLKAAPMYRDNRGGRFVALYVNGDIIAKGEQVQAVAGRDEMRPRSMVRADEPVKYSMPDSLSVQQWTEEAKENISFWKTELGRSMAPVWDFLMWFFFTVLLMPAFAVIGIVKMVSKTARNEAYYGISFVGRIIWQIHEAASGIMLICLWVVATVFLIEEFLFLTRKEAPFFVILIVWALSIWIASAVINWQVPDPPGRKVYIQQNQNMDRLLGA